MLVVRIHHEYAGRGIVERFKVVGKRALRRSASWMCHGWTGFEISARLAQAGPGDPSAQDASGRHGGFAFPGALPDLPPCAASSAAENPPSCASPSGAENPPSCASPSGAENPPSCASPSGAEGSLRHHAWRAGQMDEPCSSRSRGSLGTGRLGKTRGVYFPGRIAGPASLCLPERSRGVPETSRVEGWPNG